MPKRGSRTRRRSSSGKSSRRRLIDEAEIRSRELTESEQITLELSLENGPHRARTAAERARGCSAAARSRSSRSAGRSRSPSRRRSWPRRRPRRGARRSPRLRMSRPPASRRSARSIPRGSSESGALDALNIAKRQAFEEAEITSGEEIERARIATERGTDRGARVTRRRYPPPRGRARPVESSSRRSRARSRSRGRRPNAPRAIAASEGARAKAIAAEEQAITAREREIAERRKTTELIAAAARAEREALAPDPQGGGREEGRGKPRRRRRGSPRRARRRRKRSRREAAAARYEVDAKGAMQLNEAENTLSDAARLSRFRGKLLERIEGIVRESVQADGEDRGASRSCISTARTAPGRQPQCHGRSHRFGPALPRPGADDRQPHEGDRHRGRRSGPHDRSACGTPRTSPA